MEPCPFAMQVLMLRICMLIVTKSPALAALRVALMERTVLRLDDQLGFSHKFYISAMFTSIIPHRSLLA